MDNLLDEPPRIQQTIQKCVRDKFNYPEYNVVPHQRIITQYNLTEANVKQLCLENPWLTDIALKEDIPDVLPGPYVHLKFITMVAVVLEPEKRIDINAASEPCHAHQLGSKSFLDETLGAISAAVTLAFRTTSNVVQKCYATYCYPDQPSYDGWQTGPATIYKFYIVTLSTYLRTLAKHLNNTALRVIEREASQSMALDEDTPRRMKRKRAASFSETLVDFGNLMLDGVHAIADSFRPSKIQTVAHVDPTYMDDPVVAGEGEEPVQ